MSTEDDLQRNLTTTPVPELPDTSLATKFLLSKLKVDRPTRVVDVGANPINDAPYKALLQMGGCDVIGFEPQPDEFQKLEQMKSNRETYFPFAVGDGSTKVLKIYLSSGRHLSMNPTAPLELFWDGVGYCGSASVCRCRPLLWTALTPLRALTY